MLLNPNNDNGIAKAFNVPLSALGVTRPHALT